MRLFTSLQARMVAIFLLVILLVMDLAGTYLLHSLQVYYVDQYYNGLKRTAETLAGGVAQHLAEGSLADLDRLVAGFGEKGVELAIADGQGVAVSSSGDELVGRRLAYGEVRRALEGRLEGAVRQDPATGRRKVYLAAPVAYEGRVVGAVSMVASLDRIDETLGGMRNILLTATLLALLVASLLSFLLARTITGPVKELTARAGELAAGRFDRLIEVRSQDEVGVLAGMFNHLTVRLRETLDEISEEKGKAEAILTHMADGIVAVDREGRVILMNPAAARMLGDAPAGMTGRPLDEILPDAELAVVLGAALRGPAVGGAAAAGSGEEPVVLLRRGDLTLRAQVATLHDPGGRPRGVVVVLQDVTQQERLEAMRREFVANVSHELRTPLTTIKSYVETLMDVAREDPETLDRFLSVVAGETDRMVRLVNDLLTLSRMDNHQVQLDRRPLDLNELVKDVVEKFQDRCRRKAVDLVAVTGGDLPPVPADRDRLEQVFSNLLNNAVDFTPEGGRVEVVAETARQGVRARVRDTGVGIPPEDLPRIFERFYRVDKARSREFGGTGLGLAIAREIVEAHGGSIGIESVPGRGTTVSFTLPLAGRAEAKGAGSR